MYVELWNCNRLWKIWYCLLVTSMQIYVTYNAIRNYVFFKSQYFNPRYGGDWNFGPLHFYLACIIGSTSLICFFIYFSIINIRNPSHAEIRSYFVTENEGFNNWYGPIFRFVLELARKKLPYAPILHLIMAVFLILPLPMVHMEQIRNEALSPDSILMGNLDFFSDHFSWMKMEFLQNQNTLKNFHYIMKSNVLHIEFINFVIATIIFVVRLPGVLWNSNKWFSVFYSIVTFINCLTWLIMYEAGSILIKISGNIALLNNPEITKSPIEHSTMLSIISTHFILILLGFLAVFLYGQTQSVIYLLRGFGTFKFFNQNNFKKNFWIFSIIAIGFSLLLITLIIDSVAFTRFYKCFQVLHMSIFLVAIIFGIITLVVQFLVWFTFSIKTRWVFHFDLPENPQSTSRTNDTITKYHGSPDTIYGCFRNNITLSTTSHSSGRGTVRTLEEPIADNVYYGTNFQNYVYVQNPTTQIPTISEYYDENNTNTSKSSSNNANGSRNNVDNEHDIVYRATPAMSDSGLIKMNENFNSDTYRSLQMINNRKSGKLVTFHDLNEEKIPYFGTHEKGFSNSNMDQLNFLKVPDILNLNRSTLSVSLSESSLDQISSSLSSKVAVENHENGMCSDV